MHMFGCFVTMLVELVFIVNLVDIGCVLFLPSLESPCNNCLTINFYENGEGIKRIKIKFERLKNIIGV